MKTIEQYIPKVLPLRLWAKSISVTILVKAIKHYVPVNFAFGDEIL